MWMGDSLKRNIMYNAQNPSQSVALMRQNERMTGVRNKWGGFSDEEMPESYFKEGFLLQLLLQSAIWSTETLKTSKVWLFIYNTQGPARHKVGYNYRVWQTSRRKGNQSWRQKIKGRYSTWLWGRRGSERINLSQLLLDCFICTWNDVASHIPACKLCILYWWASCNWTLPPLLTLSLVVLTDVCCYSISFASQHVFYSVLWCISIGNPVWKWRRNPINVTTFLKPGY